MDGGHQGPGGPVVAHRALWSESLRWQRDSLNEACFVYALLLHGDVLFLVLFLSPYTLS